MVLDLDTFQTHPHSYKFYITKKLNYEFPGISFLKQGFDFYNDTINNFICTIFPEPQKLDYIYNLFSSFLSDKIPNDNIHVLFGRRSNGKTFLMKILRLILG